MRDPKQLTELIQRLVQIEPTASPLISCVVRTGKADVERLTRIDQHAKRVRERLDAIRREHFDDALAMIRNDLKNQLGARTKSAVFYARGGSDPLFLKAEFGVPAKPEFIVDHLPHLYPHVERKDVHQRFVTVVTTETDARILETALGSVTEGILPEHAEPREHAAGGRAHPTGDRPPQGHPTPPPRANVQLIDELMSKRGINYLILAGSPPRISRLRAELPEHLNERLVSTILARPGMGTEPIVWDSILHVVAAEHMESLDRVAALEQAILSRGPAVAGYEGCARALEEGNAELLFVDQHYGDVQRREMLVRLAESTGVEVETVNRSATLRRLSGVGCLLARTPDRNTDGEQQVA